MKRVILEENNEAKGTSVKQEAFNFGYDVSSYANYSSSSSPSTVAQSLPGQPPLLPMPPPPSGVPPSPHVFGSVPSQVAPLQAWPHAPWITPQTTPLPSPTPHEIANTFPREMPLRGNYVRRERFTHNRSNIYVQRNNFHRKNRRLARFGQLQGQFEQAAYFGATLTGGLDLEWQRNNYTAATNDAIINHMSVPIPNHPISPIPPGVKNNRHSEETEDHDEEIIVKNDKHNKPMSQSYPSKPWNREDAEKALKTENEYRIEGQSLIIKFPDPDLNKDIVRSFHPGIQNVRFQSPSRPRYCFIQMTKNVNIDNAIKDLEKIQFGVGYLKVEKKSLRDEDKEPLPEEINPYVLYIGNLPKYLKVKELKNKFPVARVDAGYPQKMWNTRYAFLKHDTVDESIATFKQAHGMMWDTRSIIVRFLRFDESDGKKIKMELNNAAQVKKEQNTNHVESKSNKLKEKENNTNQVKKENKINYLDKSSMSPNMDKLPDQKQNKTSLSALPISITAAKTVEEQQPWTVQPSQIPSALETPPSCPTEAETMEKTILTEIKEEPLDYDIMSGDDDDDDDDDDEELDETDDDDDKDDFQENDEDGNIDNDGSIIFSDKSFKSQPSAEYDEEPTDHLDQMFNDLENMTGDIGFFKH